MIKETRYYARVTNTRTLVSKINEIIRHLSSQGDSNAEPASEGIEEELSCLVYNKFVTFKPMARCSCTHTKWIRTPNPEEGNEAGGST